MNQDVKALRLILKDDRIEMIVDHGFNDATVHTAAFANSKVPQEQINEFVSKVLEGLHQASISVHEKRIFPRIRIDEVTIPIELDDSFNVSVLEKVCNHYPWYVQKVRRTGGTPRPFKEYLMIVIKKVETGKCAGYDGVKKKCFDDFLMHVGLAKYEEWCTAFRETEGSHADA